LSPAPNTSASSGGSRTTSAATMAIFRQAPRSSEQFIGGVTMFRFTRVATVLASLMLCAALWAQTEPTTSVSLPPGPLKVTIKSVKGIVQFRTTADAKWEKAAEGSELSEGAELRTGPRSTVQFSIGDDQLV